MFNIDSLRALKLNQNGPTADSNHSRESSSPSLASSLGFPGLPFDTGDRRGSSSLALRRVATSAEVVPISDKTSAANGATNGARTRATTTAFEKQSAAEAKRIDRHPRVSLGSKSLIIRIGNPARGLYSFVSTRNSQSVIGVDRPVSLNCTHSTSPVHLVTDRPPESRPVPFRTHVGG